MRVFAFIAGVIFVTIIYTLDIVIIPPQLVEFIKLIGITLTVAVVTAVITRPEHGSHDLALNRKRPDYWMGMSDAMSLEADGYNPDRIKDQLIFEERTDDYIEGVLRHTAKMGNE